MSWKDPELKGKYVRRCKCGNRPYHDRCMAAPITYWIACNCGRETMGVSTSLDTVIEWWNKGLIKHQGIKKVDY